MADNPQTEVLTGYVVDVACLRRYPHMDRLQRAQQHTRACALEGHCIESGYGLVTDDDLVLLDPAATLPIVERVRASSRDRGIRLRVVREREGDEMVTRQVEVAD